MDYKATANEYFKMYYEILMAEELRRQEEIERQKILPVIELANKGDAVGTGVIRDGLTYIDQLAFYACKALKKNHLQQKN